MKIVIKGLGAVKQASIDLTKRLTVFCGHNNTGKTYVSYIIYSLTCGKRFTPKIMSDKELQQLVEKKHLTITLELNDICNYRKEILKNIEDNLNELFGISKEQANKYFNQFSIDFETSDDDLRSKIITEEFDAHLKGTSFQININKKKGNLDVDLDISFKGSLYSNDLDTIRFMTLSNLYNSMALYPIAHSTIFPVERNSIYTFSKELSIKRNILVDQMQDMSKGIDPLDFLFRRTTRYPQPIRDGLEIAEDLGNLQKNESDFKSFGEEIESELLEGKVSVSNEGEVQFTSLKAKSKKLPIHLTASIVKTLSSLVFYLKYIAQKGDLIIIDEPELNLHPDNQIVLTRIFARLLNNGFRLLISTHSDYIIREINNLIMLSSKKDSIKKLREDFGYKANEYIPYSEVNAYYFAYKTKNIVSVRSLSVTEEGFEVPSIDDTIDKLNNTSEELFYAIKNEELYENS